MKKYLILLLVCVYGCNNITMVDVHREYLQKNKDGIIAEIVMYKGQGYVLNINNLKKNEDIAVSKIVGKESKIGDQFIKIKNSNKCQLKRKDSVICFNCLDFSNKDRDSLGRINEWKNSVKNRWMKNN